MGTSKNALYVKKHRESKDQINVLLPKGTKDRIKKLNISCNSFAISAIMERLEREESWRKGKED